MKIAKLLEKMVMPMGRRNEMSRHPKAIKEMMALLRACLARGAAIPVRNWAKWAREEHGIKISDSAMRHFLVNETDGLYEKTRG